MIRVRDTGIGMNEEDIALLFKKFVRIRNEKTMRITGSGLGLSIVSKLTEIYGGEIQVESKPDEGSEFRIILPVC
ncbi:MAG: ATP-binding protein [Bacteroidales bacterium]